MKKLFVLLLAVLMMATVAMAEDHTSEASCDHIVTKFTSNEDGTHTGKCDCESHTSTKNCVDNGSGECECGYVFPVEEESKCELDGHELVKFVPDPAEPGKHMKSCECGDRTNKKQGGSCTYENGICTECGYACPHAYVTVESDDAGKHTETCICGGYSHTGLCKDTDSDGLCDVCTYKFPAEEPACQHETLNVESDGTGKHTETCVCGGYSHTATCKDNGEGKCGVCDYEFPVEEPECEHILSEEYVSDNAGKHTASCECGHVTHTRACVDNGEGKCNVCGYEFPVEEPTAKPVYPYNPPVVVPPAPTPVPTPEPTPVPPVVTPEPELPEEPVEPELPVDTSNWYYGNTMTAYGPTSKELGGSDWHRVTPVDLAVDGVYTYDLVASNRYVVGYVTIKVEAGVLTVTYRVKANPADVTAESLKIYASMADLAEGNAVEAAIGEGVNIAETFGADTKVIVSLVLTGNYDAEGHNVTDLVVDADESAAMIANMD